MTSEPIVPSADGALVRLRVSPNAETTTLRSPRGGAILKLRVTAPPVDGKANAEGGRFVAERTGAAPPRVVGARGLSGRDKTVLVDGVGAERVREVLRPRQR